jgi:hypothetical protein
LSVVLPRDYLSAATGSSSAGASPAGGTRLVDAGPVLARLVVGITAAAEVTGRDGTRAEYPVTPSLPFLVVVAAWLPFCLGLALAFDAPLGTPRWLVPSVIGTLRVQQVRRASSARPPARWSRVPRSARSRTSWPDLPVGHPG